MHGPIQEYRVDPNQPPMDSQALLDQGEELLDSSRQLLAHLDDALGIEPAGEPTTDATPGLDSSLSA